MKKKQFKDIQKSNSYFSTNQKYSVKERDPPPAPPSLLPGNPPSPLISKGKRDRGWDGA